MPHGEFAWNELVTNDVAKAKDFYQSTVGWTLEAMPMPNGEYWIASANGKPVAGIIDVKAMAPAGTPPHWFAYLEVDDVDARLKKIAAKGGKVVREPFDIPGVGRIAILADATGAMMGWMTSKR